MPFYVKSLNNETKENKFYGCIVRRAREEHNSSVNFMAEITFVNPSHLSKIEHGKHAASEEYKTILENALGIKVNTSITFQKEAENKFISFLNFWATCDIKGINQIYDEFIEKQDEYKYSYGFIYYDFVNVFYLIIFEKDLGKAKRILDDMEDYKNLLDIPYQLFYYDLLAQYYLKTNNRDKSNNIYEEINNEIPSSPKKSVLFSVIYYHLAYFSVLINEIDLAVKYYKKARNLLADLYMFERISYLGIVMANGYAKVEMYDKAMNIYENILKYYQRVKSSYEINMVYANIGYCKLKEGKYEEAIYNIRNVGKVSQTYECIDFYEPYALWMMKMYKEAKEVINVNINTKSEKSKVIQNVILYSINNEIEKAMESCSQAIQLIEKDKDFENQEFVYKIGLKIATENNLLEEKCKYLELLYSLK